MMRPSAAEHVEQAVRGLGMVRQHEDLQFGHPVAPPLDREA
jgi:hypothetical protein